jgi:hypothetical protein
MRFFSLFFILLASLSGQGPAAAVETSSNTRFPFAVSDFFVASGAAKEAAPLSNAEKFKMSLRCAISPIEFVRYAAQAGISQAEDHDAEYGQGGAAYGKRFALRFADGTVEGLFTHAIFPSLRHEDPRYFQLGEGNILHRAAYAFSRIFVTRTDAGDTQVNVSELAGSATAAGISTFTYHPRGERTLGTALNVWGYHVAFDALRNGVLEFLPDISRKFRRGQK